MILRSSIASLKQYNQYLLEQNKSLKDLVKKYMKLLRDLQSNEVEEFVAEIIEAKHKLDKRVEEYKEDG